MDRDELAEAIHRGFRDVVGTGSIRHVPSMVCSRYAADAALAYFREYLERCLLDEIDLFRIIRGAGRSDRDKAFAVRAALIALSPKVQEGE